MAGKPDDDDAYEQLRINARTRGRPYNDSESDFARRIERDLRLMMDAVNDRRQEGGCKGMVWVMLSLQLASTAHLAEMLAQE